MIITMRQQIIFWSVILMLIFGSFWLLGNSLSPFVSGFILAYLLDPLVQTLCHRFKLSRIWATTLAMALTGLMFVVFFLLFLPILFQQVQTFIVNVPTYVSDTITFLETSFGKSLTSFFSLAQVKTFSENIKNNIPETAKAVVSALEYAGAFSASLLSGGMAIINILTFLVIVPVVSFYLLIDWQSIIQKIDDLLPRQHLYTIRKLARESDEVLSAFLRGQFLVCLLQALYYSLTLQIIGLQYGFLIGLLAGIFSIVPYVGAFLGFTIAILIGLKQFGLDWVHLLLISGVYGIGQILEGYLLVPRLVGSSVGLHPLWVMFSLMAFGQLFGFLGVLIAVPVMAIVGVVMRFIQSQYMKSRYYMGLPEVPDHHKKSSLIVEGECRNN